MQNAIQAWGPAELARLRRLAAKWYSVNGRELPWRLTSDPYCIWVSEIMLQQTQVATVIPYYFRFIESFPTVASLAKAPLDDLYRHWSGLGYYRRARQMHEAANEICNNHNGCFPTEYEKVIQLPGVGRYTAGAVLTFSMDQRLPIVEANTQRLYSRLLHLQIDTASKEGQARLWSFAELVLPSRTGSGRLNQALMEIGSQVCLPKNPLCLLCPLHTLCPTFGSGSQATIPLPKKSKEFTDLREAALVIQDTKGRILMRRCESDERWSGLWDFPRFDVTPCQTASQETNHISSQFESRFGNPVLIGKQLHELKHSVTRYRITLKSYEAQLDSSAQSQWDPKIEIAWANPTQLSSLALSSSGKKLWAWVIENRY